MTYIIHKASGAVNLNSNWEDPCWFGAEMAGLKHFRPEGSDHRPQTFVRLLHDGRGIHGIFRVHDRYVRCVRTEYHSEVWKDSCVEFFAEPRSGRGYFNFEFNCGGAFLCSYVVDPTPAPGGFRQFTKLPAEIGRQIQTRPSLPRIVDPETSETVTWTLQFLIPLTLFEKYLGPLGDLSGQIWRGNFYKCADDTSHPHWGSWLAVDELNFHLPRCFGDLYFD
jgi:hypothetical protein